MNKTLVIYEFPAAEYDVLHWIERFKDKIQYLEKSDKFGKTWEISLDNNEELLIIPFDFLHNFNYYIKQHYLLFPYNKVIIVGRIPKENIKIMEQLKKILYEN